MRKLSVVLSVAWLAFVAGCGGRPPSPPSTGGDDGSIYQLRGNERLAWDQSAETQAELAGGVLRLRLPKALQAQPRAIQIKTPGQ